MSNPAKGVGMTSQKPPLDICEYCEGTGERDWLSGAPCFECNGRGLVEVGRYEGDDDYEDDPATTPEEDSSNA